MFREQEVKNEDQIYEIEPAIIILTWFSIDFSQAGTF